METEATAQRIGSHARSGVVVIEIGSARTTYHVYKRLLAKHSEYFDRALDGEWDEAQKGVISLDDVDCNTFEIFVEWLHVQRPPARFSEWLEPGVDSEGQNETRLVQMAMVKACVFGDGFLAQHFRAAAEHVLVEMLLHSSISLYEVVTHAFDRLPAENPVLQAMIDVHCDRVIGSMDEKHGEAQFRDHLLRSFLVGTMSRYMKIKGGGGGDSELLDRCKYHSHGDSKYGLRMCLKPNQIFINDLDSASRKDHIPVLRDQVCLNGRQMMIQALAYSTRVAELVLKRTPRA